MTTTEPQGAPEAPEPTTEDGAEAEAPAQEPQKPGVHARCRRWAGQIGRRGAALLVFGVIYVLAGFPLLIAPSHSELHVYELRIWGLVFVCAGVVAWLSAFRRHVRHDRAGFLILMLVGWLWVAYCALSSILHLLQPLIFPSLVGLTFENAALMILILVTSGWPEPIEPVDLAGHLAHDMAEQDAANQTAALVEAREHPASTSPVPTAVAPAPGPEHPEGTKDAD